MEIATKRRKSSRYRYKQLSPETIRMIELNKDRINLTEEQFLDLLPQYVPLSELEKQLKIEEKIISKKEKEESDIKGKVEKYLHSEENQPIVLESEYPKMIQSLRDFYDIKITPEQIEVFIYKMNQMIIKNNKDLYVKDNNVYDSKSLQFLSEIKVPQQEFANILLSQGINASVKSNIIPENELFQTSFPIIQLCNLIIQSSKLFFSYVLEGEVIVLENYSSNFETNNLGSIFYTQYFSDQYHKIMCSVASDSFQQVLDQSKKINDSIETFYSDFLDYVEKLLKSKNPDLAKTFWEKYQSFYNSYYLLILLYISRINDTINRNGYIFELLKRAGDEISENVQMLFDDRRPKYQQLIVNKTLNGKILECLKGNQSYILIPLDIRRDSWGNDSHQNILLVDIKRKLVERYEPHGSISVKKDEDINSEIWWFFLSFGLRYKYDLCSVSSIQDIEKQFSYELGGKCVSLTYGYLDHRLSSKTQTNQGLPPEFAPIRYYNLANEKGMIHWYDLNTLNSQIFTELQKYIDQINDYFDSNLLFKRNTLTFLP
jgi:hypothetical protein